MLIETIIIGFVISVAVGYFFYWLNVKKNKSHHREVLQEIKKLNIYEDGLALIKNRDKIKILSTALINIKTNKYDSAINVLNEYLNIFKVSEDERCAILNLIGISLYEKGENKKSIGIFSEMIYIAERIQNKEALAFGTLNLGATHAKSGNYKEALEAFDKVIKINPRYVKAWYNKGNAFHELVRHQEALDMFNKAIELKPDYVEALSNKGGVLCELGRHQEALDIFNRALKVKPDNAMIWDNKGTALCHLGYLKEALAAFDKAIEINSDFAKSWYNKGVILDKLGRHQEALEALDKAIDIKPDYDKAWYKKSAIDYFLGNKEEAFKSLSQAIKINPEVFKKISQDLQEDFKNELHNEE